MTQVLPLIEVGGPDKNTKITPDNESWFLIKDFESEEWRDVPGYEGYYEVSNIGRIKSVDRIITKSNGASTRFFPHILSFSDRFGYFRVCLYKCGKKRFFFVHQLVAMAFIPNPNKFPVINHKNECPQDNRVDNLEWCTQRYNLSYGNRNTKAYSKIREKMGVPIDQYSLDGKYIKTYACVNDAGKEGFSHGGIRQCITKLVRQYKGYIWVPNGEKCEPLRDRTRYMKVYKYDLNNNLVDVYPNIKDAEKKNNMKSRAIKAIRYGDRKSNIVNGYKYMFNPINM